MRQDYANYTAEDHQVWQLLFDRQMMQLPSLASRAYLEGIAAIGFTRERIPNYEETNKHLMNITGWSVEVVKGLIPNKEFFELLLTKRFPASTWLRKLAQLDYLEEPDMFHDTFGHIPMLTNHDFCGFLKELSRIALRFLDSEVGVEMIARLYWYTVEFGLIQDPEGLKIYGAGIISSSGESVYSLSDKPQKAPFDVLTIVNTPYIRDKFQEKYFVINSYRELYESLPILEKILEQELMQA
ncbi:MAG: phenylalanine 4-monooxygenase [Cytophagales bacterium]|nr:MAG: phenylalanine 4-monooxygenase [Cytophagales bacterium]